MTNGERRIMADFTYVNLTAQSMNLGPDIHQVSEINSSLDRIIRNREKHKEHKYGRIADLTGHQLYALVQSSPGAFGGQFLELFKILATEARKKWNHDIAYRPEMSKMMYIRRLATNAAIFRTKSLITNCSILSRSYWSNNWNTEQLSDPYSGCGIMA